MVSKIGKWILVGLLVWVRAGGAEPGARGGGLPFEPEVTGQESRLLQTALAVAETNTAAAVGILATGDRRGPALAFTAGNLLFQAGDYPGAAEAYREAIEKLPRFRSALANLGRVYLLQDRPGEAIELYQQLLADGQADADILLLLGHALLMEDSPVSAEGAYRQSLLLRPRQVEALTGLAKTLFVQERFQEALALTGEILAQKPEEMELWNLRVNAYLVSGRYGDAIRAIETAHRLGAADAEMLATMGDLLLNEDQAEDALRAYREAMETSTLPAERLMRAVEGFLMAGDLDGAEGMLGTVASLPAEEVEARETRLSMLRLRSEIAWQRGDAAAARTYADSVLRLDPLDGRTLLLLASIEETAGNLEGALILCERAARISGFEADALVRQAQIAVMRQRYEEAIRLLEAAQVYREQAHVGRYLDQLRRMQQ